tara:strand:+ start:11781 stop:12449 length:669 start_codon:yes stop_codon:yes gene_type:complete
MYIVTNHANKAAQDNIPREKIMSAESRKPRRKSPHPALDLNQDRYMRHCDREGCPEEGVCKAPKSRENLREYYWFCKAHAREYNARWDFFADMTQDEIYAFERDSRTWHRPTWKIGTIFQGEGNLEDRMGIFDDLDGFGPRFTHPGSPTPGRSAYSAEDMQQLGILGLDETARMDDIRRAYKKLVKKYHPDVNGGGKETEEIFKRIINAYHHFTSKQTGKQA